MSVQVLDKYVNATQYFNIRTGNLDRKTLGMIKG